MSVDAVGAPDTASLSSALPRRDRAWFLAGVFLTCMCGLMLQIMETRVLSVIAFYHFAFLAIGVAMLGMTAGALAVFRYAAAAYSAEDLSALLSKLMAGFAWSVLASLVVLLTLALGGAGVGTLQFFVQWLVAILVLLPPYALLGAVVSLALTRSPYRINIVYCVDLVGASGGCLVALAIMSAMDTYTAVLLVGAIGAFAGLAFGRASGAKDSGRLRPSYAAMALLAVAAANLMLGSSGLRPTVVKEHVERVNEFPGELWNSFSRITVEPYKHAAPYMFSASRVAPPVQIDWAYLTIDGAAGTPSYRFNGDPRTVDFLKYDSTALAYYIRHSGRSAVIGIGGGRDLLTASNFGFRDITGVEYNPIFVRLFTGPTRVFTGSDRIPGLKIYTDDARSWFARSDQQFDLIQMSMIDTFAATGAGAFTLSENGLYTVDGWKRFTARLSPTGVFTVSRWYSPFYGDETARILSLAMATLIETGVPQPSDHIYLIGNGPLSTLILSKAPLSAADIATLDATSKALGYTVFVAPGRPASRPTFERLLQATTTRQLIDVGSHTTLNVTPTWDSNPFFFNQLRLGDRQSIERAKRAASGVIYGNLQATNTLLALILISTLVVAAVVLIPSFSAVRGVGARAAWLGSAYFLAIGFGFMFAEIGLIQRLSIFMGHPIFGLAVVLFSVIMATGVGSFFSVRAMPLNAVTLVAWPLLLAAYLAALPLWLGHVLTLAEPGGTVERAALCFAVVAPGGCLMGFMFPTGMRLYEHLEPRLAPWLWAVNGAAGVLASSLAVLISIQTSLNVALWIAAGAYAALAAIAPAIDALAKSGDRVSDPTVQAAALPA